MKARLRVKICGVTRVEDAVYAVELGADAIGFIFWPGSPRIISETGARAIADALPPFVTRVGVFVNATSEQIRRTTDEVGLDVVQLHGDEKWSEFGGSVGRRIIRAVTIESSSDVEAALAWPREVGLLVDAADRERRGGTGQRANWILAATLAKSRRIVLAGGISADTVAEAARQVQPWGVDVSSGVEESPGVKSRAKLRDLFAAVSGMEVE